MDAHSHQFADRRAAGADLAGRLSAFTGRDDVVVLALPRGGVPVAFEIASALGAPLDVFVVRKLGVPGHAELAMGAIASGGVRVLNDEVIAWYGLSPAIIESVAARERIELQRREQDYRGGAPLIDIADRTVIVVDDGLATGSTMKAAVEALRGMHPKQIVVAVPVGASDTCRALAALADDVICARMPEPFSAVGLWYRNFSQTSDDEVRNLLRKRNSEVRTQNRNREP